MDLAGHVNTFKTQVHLAIQPGPREADRPDSSGAGSDVAGREIEGL